MFNTSGNDKIIEAHIGFGFVPGYSFVNKFGRNPSIDVSTTPEDVWGNGGLYTGFPTGVAETLSIVSTSANDTSAGTGARSIRIIGLDNDYNPIEETVNLNGTTPVLTTQAFKRAHTAYIVSSGSGQFNAGDITVNHSTTTANIFFKMLVGNNQTRSSAYTIPAGKVGLMNNIHAAIVGQTTSVWANGSIYIREYNQAPRLRRPFTITHNTNLYDTMWGGVVLPEKTDVIIRIVSTSTNNLEIVAGYDILLINNGG